MEKKSQISSTKGDSNTEFGFIPKAQLRGSDADIDNAGNASLKSFKNIGSSANDEFGAPSLFRKKRNTWNSVDFENEDFLSGFKMA
jgi:hypothetical protein